MGSRKSETRPVPERWMRKEGAVLRRRRPVIRALMEGSWSESPLWMTMLAEEAAEARISELS